MKNLKTSRLRNAAIAVIALLLIADTTAQAQSWMPVLRDERGDTIPYTFPPADSTFQPNELIIKFRKGALNLSKLCFECEDNDLGLMMGDPVPADSGLGIPAWCKNYVMGQRFPIDGGILLSSNLVSTIQSFGGTHLRRITSANPCTDSLSVSRQGDTLKIDDWNWMVLDINNDTSVVNACLNLTIFHQSQIELAEPNYYISLLRNPNDYFYTNPYFLNPSYQTSLQMIGMPTVWNYQVGSSGIRVGVVDNGIDYRHCDLGAAKGIGEKVVDGWNYVARDTTFYANANHGTPVAGIIGAFTNRSLQCASPNVNSVAGIAGGWYNSATGEDSIGVSLYGFKVYPDNNSNNDDSTTVSRAISAIREASANSSRYGYRMDVLNNSWHASPSNLNRDTTNDLVLSLRAAVNDAYEHGVSFVAARGNQRGNSLTYPSGVDASWVTSVGGGDRFKNLHSRSNFGNKVDLIAPYGGLTTGDSTWERTVYTTDIIISTNNNRYDFFDGTSAAAPHVSGVIALLRSHNLRNQNNGPLDPEDYENMLKASAEDRPPSANYDPETGWGHLRADNIFTMIEEENYSLTHITYSGTTNTPGVWKNLGNTAFSNSNQGAGKPLSGVYPARIREVTATFDLTNSGQYSWSNTKQLYVWGRGGNKSMGGWSDATPNFQSRWTEVQSGTGGGTNKSIVEGILHSNQNLTCTARTFQYEVLIDTVWRRYPADNELAFHVTVFGAPYITSVQVSKDAPPGYGLEVFPNPAQKTASLRYAATLPGTAQITIANMFGSTVLKSAPIHSEPGIYEERFDVSELPSGVYYCTVTTLGVSTVQPLIINR